MSVETYYLYIYMYCMCVCFQVAGKKTKKLVMGYSSVGGVD